jgi:hypothetical protein
VDAYARTNGAEVFQWKRRWMEEEMMMRRGLQGEWCVISLKARFPDLTYVGKQTSRLYDIRGHDSPSFLNTDGTPFARKTLLGAYIDIHIFD